MRQSAVVAASGGLIRRRILVGAATIALCLALLVLVGMLSLEFRPAALASAAWWPSAGIGVGLGILFPRRMLAVTVPLVFLATIPLGLFAGFPPPLTLTLALAVALEMLVGALILRGRADRHPALREQKDLARLVIAAAAAAVVFTLVGTVSEFLLDDPARALERLITGTPKHLAGILLVTPLFMSIRRRDVRPAITETVVQIAITATIAIVVFFLDTGLPLSFLALFPLTWAATRLPLRIVLFETLGMAVISTFGSALGHGPFSFVLLGPETGSVVLQVFQTVAFVVSTALALAAIRERRARERLRESEELFRRTFETTVAGVLILEPGVIGWLVRRANTAAEAMFGGAIDRGTPLSAVLGREAASDLRASLGDDLTGSAQITVTLPDGRTLDASLAAIDADEEIESDIAVQLVDVSDATRLREYERQEIERAVRIQRALTPAALPSFPGWEFAAYSDPAREVGGDFYDIRTVDGFATVCVGDVMGKGVGAGMLAAATRATLRSMGPAEEVEDVIERTAAVLAEDLARSESFITLGLVRVDLMSGHTSVGDAGQGLQFVVRGRTGEVERYASMGLPLGIAGDPLDALTTRLATDDVLVLVSDGVLELYDESMPELTAALSRLAGRTAADIVAELCTRSHPAVDADDVTAVAVRRGR